MRWDTAATAARETAAARATAVEAVRVGGPVDSVAAAVGVSAATLRRWVRLAAAAEREGIAPAAALVDRKRSGRPPTVWSRPGAEAAWALWRANYLRQEAPTAAGCWETVRRVAIIRGWQLPPVQAFLRRLRAEVPAAEVVRARKGRLAALETMPFQRRTVEGLLPLELVSGDGYRHNLFVRPPGGGDPIRPITWAWQDVRTRKMLGWRSGETESADLVRLAFHQLVTEHGVPGAVVQDNTRAASAKWFSGSGRRWRHDAGVDVPGILDLLGVRVIHTGVEREVNGKAKGHGWAKPVERAFLELGELVDKHPFAEGAYTGRAPGAKPANYDPAQALDWDDFLAIRDDGIKAYNARPGRRMEAADGRSIDKTWEAETATTPMRKLTRAQEALLLMAVESTNVQRSGLFRLTAGKATGLPANDYYHPDLVGMAGRHVVARFDPQQLHAGVEVFDLEGRWICRAECRLPVGFGDSAAAKTYGRERRRMQRGLDQADAARQKLGDALVEHGVRAPELPAEPERKLPPNVVRMTPDEPDRPDVARRKALQDKLGRGLRRAAEAGGY